MINTIARMMIPIRKLIHRGDNTQTHGQEITWHNLRPIKRMVSKPGKPLPVEVEDLEVMILSA